MQPAPPCPAPTHWWWTRVSGPLLHWQLCLGVYSVFFFFSPSWLCCPLRFQNSPQTLLCEGFLLCGDFSSFLTPSPGWVSVPKSFLWVFVFYILSYLLLKRLGCLSGCLVSSASIQKLFCGSCSAFKWSFDEFVGEVSGLPVLFLCYLGTAPWFTIVNWLLLHPTAVKHRKTWWRKKQWTCPSWIWDFRLLSSHWEFYQHWFCSRFHHVKCLIHWHLTFFLTFVRYIWLRLFMLKIKIC